MFEIINPLNCPNWNELVLSADNYSFFYSSNWARVLSESYYYKPLYFVEINNNKLSALIPLMEIKSILTGKRGVSLPFTDYCKTIIPEKTDFQDAMNYLIDYGKSSGWESIELRTGNKLPNVISPSSSFYGHTLDLTQGETKIFSNFRDSTKRNIKKALKEGVQTNIYKSLKSVREFYRLNCLTRREHGLPPQPWSFFEKIHDHIISRNLGSVMLASFHNRTIAGAVYFHLGDRAIYKYGASDKKYQHLRANNLVMWEAIKWYSKNGYKSFCFGRTEQENKGLMQFKRGWGTKEHLIHYYKYDLIKEAFVQDSSKISGSHNKIFKNMPIPLLKIIGSLLYKHMG
jgi:hypothetical protein